MSRSDRTYSAADREAAIKLASEVGAAEASRRLDIPSGTIRSWKHHAGEVDPPAGVDRQDWATRKAAGAEAAWRTAEQAIARVRELLDGKSESSPRDRAASARRHLRHLQVGRRAALGSLARRPAGGSNRRGPAVQ